MQQQHGRTSGQRAAAGVLVTFLVASLAVLGAPMFTSGAEAASAKVTICHRTHSTTNPYRRITVSQSAITRNGGHGGHEAAVGRPAVFDPTYAYPANGKSWGDIIPGGDAAGLPYNGSNSFDLNWTTAGKAAFASWCAPLTAREFYDVEIAAGVPEADVLADLNSQSANEDVALLAALGGSFTAGNLSQWETAVSVTTLAATSVTSTSAVLHGTLTVGTTSTVAGFQWSSDPTLAGATSIAAVPATVTGTGVATAATLSGLTPATTYWFRATGTTGAGTDTEGVLTGEVLSFTTPAAGATTSTTTSTTEPEGPTTTDPTTTSTTEPEGPATTDPTTTSTTEPEGPTTTETTTGAEATSTTSTTAPGGSTTPTTSTTSTTEPEGPGSPSTTAGPPAPSTSTTVTTAVPASGAAGRIRGIVWFDRDGDGTFDPREWLLPGVTVELTSAPVGAAAAAVDGLAAAALPVVRTAVTDAAGAYTFTGLPAGAYQVSAAVEIAGFGRTSDTDGLLDWLVAVGLPAGGDGVADFAGLGHGTLEGTLFEATTGTGLGLGTVSCRWAGYDDLPGTADDVPFTVETAPDGSFDLRGVPYGTYRCSGTDADGRPATEVEASVLSAAPVRAPLPVAGAAPLHARRAADVLARTGADLAALVALALAAILGGLTVWAAGRPQRAPVARAERPTPWT